MKYTYFIAFTLVDEDNGTGNWVIHIDCPLDNHDAIIYVEKFVVEQSKWKKIILTNFILLSKTEKGEYDQNIIQAIL